jgi:hypothetical protein
VQLTLLTATVLLNFLVIFLNSTFAFFILT